MCILQVNVTLRPHSHGLLWVEWRQALPNWVVGPSRRFIGAARGLLFIILLTKSKMVSNISLH